MKTTVGRTLAGPCGTAKELLFEPPLDRPDQEGTVASWFLDCPGQSPAWRHFMLAIVHLRPIPRVRPATITVAGSTHEVMLLALDPARNPVPEDSGTWAFLRPYNVVEQIELPNDVEAALLLAEAAQAVVNGVLPAEPPLSGAVEPWRTVLIKTAAHARGEVHES